jgi:hypothetical protein
LTDKDIRLRRAQLIVEIEDAEKELADSRSNAAFVIEEHESLSFALRRNIELEPSLADFNADAEVANRLTPTQMTYEGGQAAAVLIADMRRKRQNLFNLRKRQRGLPPA